MCSDVSPWSIIHNNLYPASLWNWHNQASPLHMQEILALSSIPLCQCFPMSTMFKKSAFYHTYQRKLLRFLFTPFYLPNSITTILYYKMSLKTSSKSFNRCRMQLPDWLHAPGIVITSLPSSSIFTGYLFLNELNSRFHYLPSRLCITRYLPSRSLRSSSTFSVNPGGILPYMGYIHSFFFIRTSNFDAEAERSYIFWRFEAETFLKMFLNSLVPLSTIMQS